MFDQLRAMFKRSRSLSFRLGILHESSRLSAFKYRARMRSVVQPHAHRLAVYDGPLDIYIELVHRGCVPPPALTSLNIVYAADPRFSRSIIDLADQFSSRNLPNLQCFQAHHVCFSANTAPFEALQYLTCSILYTDDYQKLFDHCPNLAHVQFDRIDASDVLPPVSLPRSLRTIVLRPNSKGLDIAGRVRNWAGEDLPLFVLHEASNLHGVLPLFIASHPHRVELRLNSHDKELELTTLPTDGPVVRTWRITPSTLCEEFLGGLETRGCHRLTSISVAIEQLGRFFLAQLETPGLELLEFRLVGRQEWPPLQAGDEDFVIRAPRLQRVVFNADGRADDVRAHMDEIHRALGVLSGSFRALIVYDAELLDSIALSAPAAFVREIECSGFVSFAKQYSICESA